MHAADISHRYRPAEAWFTCTVRKDFRDFARRGTLPDDQTCGVDVFVVGLSGFAEINISVQPHLPEVDSESRAIVLEARRAIADRRLGAISVQASAITIIDQIGEFRGVVYNYVAIGFGAIWDFLIR